MTPVREGQATEPLTHDRSVEELEIVALGAATPEITSGVLAHAAECTECRGELDELTLLLAALTVLIPETELNRGRSAGIRSRLMTRTSADMEAAAKRRVAAAARRKEQSAARMPAMPGWERIARAAHDAPPAAEAAAHPAPRVVPQLARPPIPSAKRSTPLMWAIIATVALLMFSAVALLLVRDTDDSVLSTTAATAQIAELEAREDSLVRVIAERDRAVQTLTAPGVRIVDLVSWASAGRPIARLFWDVESGRWSLFVYELRPPRADHIYQIWALTSQGRVSAGTFLPAEDGTGRLETTVGFSPAATRSVFISEEPLPGSRQPTGRPLAAGSF